MAAGALEEGFTRPLTSDPIRKDQGRGSDAATMIATNHPLA